MRNLVIALTAGLFIMGCSPPPPSTTGRTHVSLYAVSTLPLAATDAEVLELLAQGKLSVVGEIQLPVLGAEMSPVIMGSDGRVRGYIPKRTRVQDGYFIYVELAQQSNALRPMFKEYDDFAQLVDGKQLLIVFDGALLARAEVHGILPMSTFRFEPRDGRPYYSEIEALELIRELTHVETQPVHEE